MAEMPEVKVNVTIGFPEGWLKVADNTFKMRVDGGWLYRYSRTDEDLVGIADTMCFVPDGWGLNTWQLRGFQVNE